MAIPDHYENLNSHCRLKKVCRPRLQVRGFTIVELLILLVIFVVIVGIGIFISMLGGSQRTGFTGKNAKCRVQLKQIHSAWVLSSQTNRGSRYPVPLKASSVTANASVAPGNSTANLHSMMIFQNYYSPELVICPSESSGFVQEKYDSYDYGGQGSALAENMAWDTTFDCDITGGADGTRISNVSYANMAPPSSNRYSLADRNRIDPQRAILGDRGPKDGISDPQSQSYLQHGSRTQWSGNIVFDDGHAASLMEKPTQKTPFALDGITWMDAVGKAQPDNVFYQDDMKNAVDNWLAIFVQDEDDPTKYIPLWD